MTGSNLHFSIVIPVYNGHAFIVEAIKSCLKQTVLPYEIIVIDDASTDDTAAIIQSLNAPLVKYLCNEKNSGPSISRNRGILEAKGGWILFLDADDVFHPEKIKIIYSYLENNPAIQAIGHAFDLFVPGKTKKISAELVPVEKITSQQVLLKNPVVTPALCVSADNGILFNEEMKYAEDHDFILRTTEKYGLWFVDLPLCSLQRKPLTPGGISSDKWKMRKGEIKMLVNYCKRKNKYWLVPFLVSFSLAKHVRNWLVLK